jgi:hypothetical protein
LGRIFATYAYARVNQGLGASVFLLTRRFKIISLSYLSSLKGVQGIEIEGKEVVRFCAIILPFLSVILPMVTNQIEPVADAVATSTGNTRYSKGAV